MRKMKEEKKNSLKPTEEPQIKEIYLTREEVLQKYPSLPKEAKNSLKDKLSQTKCFLWENEIIVLKD